MNKPADKKDQLTRWEDRAAAEIAEGLGIPLNAFMRTRVRDQFLDAPMKGWVFRVTGPGGMGDVIAKHAPKVARHSDSAEPDDCSSCKKNKATVSLQQIVKGDFQKTYLCEGCWLKEKDKVSLGDSKELIREIQDGMNDMESSVDKLMTIPSVDPTAIPSVTVEDLYDAISEAPLRVKAAAAKFGVPEAVIREMIAHPDSNLVIKQAGWIQRRAA